MTQGRAASRTHDVPRWLAFLAGGSADALEDLDASAWTDALAIAERGGVLDALVGRLHVADAMSLVPAELRPRLDDVDRRTAINILSNQRTFAQLARALSSVEVPVVPYKGIDLAHHAYGDPRLRPMDDIDLWIRVEQVPAALEAARRVGFAEPTATNRAIRTLRAWDGAVPLRRGDSEAVVAELHFGPFACEWLHRAARIDRAAVWDRLQPGSLLEHPVLRLSPEDHALEVALHATIRHDLSFVPLRQLLDLTLLARAGLDLDIVSERAVEWRVARSAGLAFALAGACFDDEPLANVGERLLAVRSSGPIPPHWGLPTPAELVQGVRLSQRPIARLAYELRVTDEPGSAWRLIVGGVWPEAAWLVARYGDATPRIRWRHVIGLATGRRPPLVTDG